MVTADLLKWFEEIMNRKPEPLFADSGPLSAHSRELLTDMGSAIEAAFPPGHRILREWGDIQNAGAEEMGAARKNTAMWAAARGVFASAYSQLRHGRIESFVDSIRVGAEDDLLDQADALSASGHLVAATVLAGGALEVHLRRLCEKNNLAVTAPPSIAKYDQAIAQARNNGLTIYEKADGSQVTGWGQRRNDAAHQPDQFKQSGEEVRLMVAGVRAFIARVK